MPTVIESTFSLLLMDVYSSLVCMDCGASCQNTEVLMPTVVKSTFWLLMERVIGDYCMYGLW